MNATSPFTTTLANGLEMPRLGLGTWAMSAETETIDNIVTALELGYRLIDTASYYKNETEVGRGLRQTGVGREEIFLTTKVWNDEQGYESTLRAFDGSLKRLGQDYVDLYLMHWPVVGRTADTWRALEEIYESGRAKAIGVANFTPLHFQNLARTATMKPMVNQIELHPFRARPEITAYCLKENIAVQAYTPLARGGELFTQPEIVAIAKRHGRTPAQVALRWELQKGVNPIPKSSSPERLKENFKIFDFDLSPEEMKTISSLDQDRHVGATQFKFDGDGYLIP